MTGRICGTGFCVPERVMDNEELSRMVETSDEWIRERTGIERRHIITEETTVSMASAAAKRALSDAGISPGQVELIITATISSNVLLPCAACEVQKEIGAAEAACFDGREYRFPEKQAEKFHRPVICFVDTPGAFCGLEAEERGQGEAIARNLYEMSSLQTPVLSVVVGEGGRGGALALAVADEVWMLENAVYSILSPEGFANILWKDSGRAEEAARLMKMTSKDLLEQGIIEQVIPEPEEFTVQAMDAVTEQLEQKIAVFLEEYTETDTEELPERRYQRFRRM